ncbi:nucleotidyl transferase AbiEii/AbiGii toxin family protein [Streptomyces sp. NEAU-Y11]|uniref:nucleotidyl transferase AbiEii/AbiGii toxin family protein n=1 Tax=Streptomyces cucumeris TaxID=2962890 RepID=UPI0020C846BF|nr:nucleotidyl transferase AbiEii/AbiGii toxin family protein [Streptomyces sp. NEAU-Y11]MCP9213392.1 nucleotidyl transferase AbiEii/AbiGii toxin family protein [Streptomyces sp. NEAU-Y11]
MNLSPLHRRLLTDVLAIGTPYPLVITGGYAVQAHGLVDRLSQDLDVATENPAPMADITHALTAGLTDRGWQVREIGVDPLSGRLIVTDPTSGEECEVDILKEVFWRPPTATEYGPVLALDDVIGTKVRALADRGAVRDLIDVHAASHHHTTADLETLGRRHARDEFCLEDLQARLAGAEWYEDDEFIAYGLTEADTATLRDWARDWADDLTRRLHESTMDD